MSKNKVTQLEQKKQKLKQELSNIESALDQSIGKVKEEVSNKMDPKRTIRKYPLPAIGAAVVLGFLLGRNRKEPATYKEKKAKEAKKSIIADELKYALTRKGVHLMLDFLDQKILEMKAKDSNRID